MNCQTRLYWLLARHQFEVAHDGISTMYRIPGQQRYHGSKLDALDAAIYAEGIKTVIPDRRVSK